MGSNDTSSALHILNSFASLVGKRSLRPHVVLATVTDRGEVRAENISQSSFDAFDKEKSEEFNFFLEDSAPQGSRFFIVESVQKTLPEKVPGIAREFAEHGGEIIVSNQQQDNIHHAHAGFTEGDAVDFAQELLATEAILYEGAILTAAPVRDPNLVMLVTFNQAMVDVTRPSEMEKLVTPYLNKALRLAHNKKLEELKSLPENDAEKMLASWKEVQSGQLQFEDSQVETADQIMPDVQGMSLRKALRVLQTFGCRVMIEGSGTVKYQHPKPGSKIAGGECVLMARDQSEKTVEKQQK